MSLPIDSSCLLDSIEALQHDCTLYAWSTNKTGDTPGMYCEGKYSRDLKFIELHVASADLCHTVEMKVELEHVELA